jgi:hypothetical protein
MNHSQIAVLTHPHDSTKKELYAFSFLVLFKKMHMIPPAIARTYSMPK